jgi:hypothetical protein
MRASLTQTLPLTRLTLPRLSIPPLGVLVNLLRSRHQLRMLDDRMLRDIGVSRAQAEAESLRPVWDVPPTWKR